MSVSRSASPAARLDRAERLKLGLVEFVTKGDLKDEFEAQSKLFFDAAEPGDEHDNESVLDWFLFDWFDDDGEGAIVRFLESQPNLAKKDREILLDWLDSINSVFEIRAASKNSIELTELENGDVYTVTTRIDETPFKRGQFIIARLLPLGDDLIFSGLQFLMPDRESALAWLEMRQAFDQFDSPEAVEKAQQEQVAAFCELFGCDELTVASNKLNSTLERFQRYLLRERRDPETGMTPAERYRKELGQELSIPDLPDLPLPVAGAGEVTILCDDFDGIVLLPDFTRFKRVFETDEPERHAPDWRDLLWTYVKNPDIPIVAFERVAEQYPLRVEKVLRSLIGDKDFSLEHMYAVLLHYKQPVDGFEDLRDDQQLWDLFNGNSPSTSSGAKPRKQAKTTAKKTASRSTAKQSAKKTAAKTPQAKRTLTVKKKSVSKLSKTQKRTTSTRSAAAATTRRTAKGKAAKKR